MGGERLRKSWRIKEERWREGEEGDMRGGERKKKKKRMRKTEAGRG